jgi:hypothetical protein
MAKGDFLGEFEYIVMLYLLRLGNAAYEAAGVDPVVALRQ